MLYGVNNVALLYVREHNFIGCTFVDSKLSLSICISSVLMRVCTIINIDVNNQSFHAYAFHRCSTINCHMLVSISKIY